MYWFGSGATKQVGVVTLGASKRVYENNSIHIRSIFMQGGLLFR